MATVQKNKESDVAKVSANKIQSETGQNIVITPEMIEAGFDAASDFEEEYLGSAECMNRIYRAMARIQTNLFEL